MNLEHIRTFLEVAATGNFNRAAANLNVTQSTVSARIKSLEDRLGLVLFARSHTGAALTAPGRRLQRYALNMQRLWRQAQQEVVLPKGFRSLIGLGTQVSLWERLILKWIPWMRERAPDVAVRLEADYSTSLMRQLTDGLLDIGVMYQPRQTAGFVVEELLEEALMLVATGPRAASPAWRDDYVYVDWGDVFRARHAEAFPDMETPAVSVGLGALGLEYILENGGSGYFPVRMVGSDLDAGRLFRVDGAPVIRRPAYLVYAAKPVDPEPLALALSGLHEIAARGEP